MKKLMIGGIKNFLRLGTHARFLLTVFFFSGFSSLIYQTAWQKALSQIIGLDHYSITLIISIFMLGLGIGGAVGGYLCKSKLDLIKIYISVEFLLGIYGFFSLQILRGINAYFQSFDLGYTLDFAINFIILIFPTLLMGMSFPIILHIFRRVYPAGRAVGVVYSVNILGAAAGTLITGFLLIGIFGMINSCRLAAILNLTLGFIVWMRFAEIKFSLLVSRESNAEQSIPQNPPRLSSLSMKLIIMSLIAGFVALSYEIIFLRIFTTYFGSTSYVFPILLFSYLLMMAIGNNFFGKKADLVFSGKLFIVMAALAIITTLLALWGQEFIHTIGLRQNYFVLWPFRTWLVFAQIIPILIISFILMTPVAFISGFFPVIVKKATQNSDELGSVAGYLYFTQTLGNFGGTLVTGLILLPVFGTVLTLKIMAGLLGLVVALEYSSDFLKIFSTKRQTALIVVSLAAVFIYPANFYKTVRFYYEGDKSSKQAPAVIKEGAFGATLGYKTDNNSQMQVYVGRLFSNSYPLKSSGLEGIDSSFPMDWIASIRGLEVQRVLYVGMGSGTGLFCIKKFFPEAIIDVVEINPELVEMMEEDASEIVLDVIHNSNVHITDGCRFVKKRGDLRYDLIHIGVFNSWSSGCGNVFTVEFLQMLSDRLTPNGVVTYNAYPPVVKSGLKVFKDLVIFSPGLSRISEVCASNSKIELDPGRFIKNLTRLESESGEGTIRINRKFIKEGCVIPRTKVESLVERISESTDDKPVTEYFLTNNQFTYAVDWRFFKPVRDMRIFYCDAYPNPLAAVLREESLNENNIR